MGLFGGSQSKRELQARANELTEAVATAMPRWFDRLGKDFPDIAEPHKATWAYFTGVAATFFGVLVLESKRYTQRETESAFHAVWGTLPRLLPKSIPAGAETGQFLDRTSAENALMEAYRDCQQYFAAECPRLQAEGVEHDLIAPTVLGSWVTSKVQDSEDQYVPCRELPKTIGLLICTQFRQWWD
ncbi:hypothetical protein L21SP4_00691 [Kiritimatiella glycovorans]|uniref:Uncharacterized protein n=2 Tax=Kiritimatiella glycovorans TaxID=1307763 RepID=A0A0G3EGN2_9BACT|nr:hypothetical protein L21SP4_00691 [Kiritimatiella glycovorans]